MSAIKQLPLPPELQELVKQFTFYSKTEKKQRMKKKRLMRQLQICERILWNQNCLFYDYFYFKIENWKVHYYDNTYYLMTQKINILSTIFCKDCHEYVSSFVAPPLCITCKCLPDNMPELIDDIMNEID
jgi:hypothetical protein